MAGTRAGARKSVKTREVAWRKAMQDPKLRALRSRNAKRRWKDPAYRAKIQGPDTPWRKAVRNRTESRSKIALAAWRAGKYTNRALGKAKTSGKCDICGGKSKRCSLHRDHDHKTGEMRGRLCFRCNAALGLLRDDPALLRAAAVYLESYRRGKR